jgi:hypothetical protein
VSVDGSMIGRQSLENTKLGAPAWQRKSSLRWDRDRQTFALGSLQTGLLIAAPEKNGG